ncbi:tRNA lysidine(34) synthetase [Natronospora cellulosivora (SeqCode)]
MKLSLAKTYTSKIIKGIAEFDMIKEGDHILVGLSGGKDSSFLLFALVILKKHLGINFNISAITIDPGFKAVDYSYLKNLCYELDVPYHIEKTKIAEYILSEEKTACAKCAHFRRGALVNYMKEKGIKKIAFGHHYDDAVETFLMSIIYSGQVLSLQAVRHLTESDIYIIRPLIYLREKQIIEGKKLIDYQEKENPCPYNKISKRAEIKEHLNRFTNDKQIFYNLAAAMREDAPIERWDKQMEEEELSLKMKSLWTGKK